MSNGKKQNGTSRRLAFRIAMGVKSALCLVHPLPLRGVPLKGKREVWRGKTESHTLHVTFRSFPPLVVNAVSQSPECVSCHMAQKGKSRNVLASPLGEEGHEVSKGCTRVRSKNDTGRRLAVRIAMEHPIGALPCTPFCLFEAFPLKGKRGI